MVSGVATLVAGTAGDHGPGGLHPAAVPGRTPVDPHDQRGPHRPGVRGRDSTNSPAHLSPPVSRRDNDRVMPRVRPGVVAWTVPAVCAALVVAALLLERRTATGLLSDPEVLINAPLSLGFATVGALVVSRRPEQGLGWLYLGSATGDGDHGLRLRVRAVRPRGGSGRRARRHGRRVGVGLGVGPRVRARCSPSVSCSTRTRDCPARGGGGQQVRRSSAVLCLALPSAFAAGPAREPSDGGQPGRARVGGPGAAAARVARLPADARRTRRPASRRWRCGGGARPRVGVQRRQIALLLVPAACVCLALLSELL